MAEFIFSFFCLFGNKGSSFSLRSLVHPLSVLKFFDTLKASRYLLLLDLILPLIDPHNTDNSFYMSI